MNNLIETLIRNYYKIDLDKEQNRTNAIREAINKFYKINEDNTADLQQDGQFNQDDENIDNEQNTNETTESDYDSELDAARKGNEMKTTSFLRANVPTIYAFITQHIPDMIKIGYTDQGAETRLKQWQKHYPDAELIGHWTAAEFNIANEHVYFKDWPVHKRVNNKGFIQINNEEKEFFKLLEINNDLIDMHVSSEFFHKYKDLGNGEKEELSTQIIEDIIKELKENIKNNENINDVQLYRLSGSGDSVKADKIWPSPQSYGMTELQKECVENGVKAIKEGKTDLLMSAVMRFGKTHASYQIIKQAGVKYALVTSAKADVRTSWRNDINHTSFINDFAFVEFATGQKMVASVSMKKDNESVISTQEDVMIYNEDGVHVIDQLISMGKIVVVFESLQSLSGELKEEFDFNGRGYELNESTHFIKEKHKYLFDNPPEIIVVDETHYGSHSQIYGAATGLSMNKEEYTKDEIKAAQQEKEDAEKYDSLIHSIQSKVTMQCSGTPYYILSQGEFADIYNNKTIISNVSFTDMLNARDKWAAEHSEEEQEDSPYFGVPNIFKYGMQLSKKARKVCEEEGVSTNLTELFRLDNNKKFVHEPAVIEIMESLFGGDEGKIPGFLNSKAVIEGEIFKHTILVLPRIDACVALRDLLLEKKIIDMNQREIIVAVEKRVKQGIKLTSVAKDSDTLNAELKRLENNGQRSLIITVNRFLTGVSIPLADSMLYMKSSKSPQEYDQAVFRLCTRNVQKIIGPNGEEHKINMKPNTYLIDFDIDRLFNMTIQSAIAQCQSKGIYKTEDIEDAIGQQLDNIPIYAEDHVLDDASGVMNGMHELKPEDLLKKYTNYNKNKSIDGNIADIIQVGGFDDIIKNADNLSWISKFTKANVNKNKMTQEDGEDNIDLTDRMDNQTDEGEYTEQEKEKKDKETKAKDNKAKEEIEKYLIGMLKTILYCNICMDDPVDDIDKFIQMVKSDEQVRKCVENFGADIDNIIYAYNNKFSYKTKANINILLYNVKMLMNDKRLKPIERVQNAIKKLGRLDDKKSEDKGIALVITPPELVKKMIDKIPEEKMRNAESILEVNSKTGEFLVEIYNRYGKEVANRVRIVAGDDRCKMFIKKVLNLLGLNEYNLLDIEDRDGSGKYDVKDFLEYKNEEIIEMSKIKGDKFSICLQNPPYGSVGGDTLHLKFVDKILDVTDMQVVVMPFGFVTKDTKSFKKYKEKFSNYLTSIEEYPSSAFQGTGFPNVAIYKIDMNKKLSTGINIQYLDDHNDNVDNLLNISKFSDYEKNIIKYLKDSGSLPIIGAGRTDKRKSEIEGFDANQIETYLVNKIKKLSLELKTYFENNIGTCGIIINQSNGGMNGTALNANNGQIFSSYKECEDFFIDKKTSSGYNVALCKSYKAAKNCKIALCHPIIRFSIYKLQDDQNMYPKVYKYVPDIDWEDDRVLTDEGLLEVCGCPKDKAKEYAEYCKKYIEEHVDNK